MPFPPDSPTVNAMAISPDGAIQSATLISSDGDMGRVLLAAADRYPRDRAIDSMEYSYRAGPEAVLGRLAEESR